MGRLAAAALTLAGISLGGCASMAPESPFDHTTLADRMSAEEAGYTKVFVDVILSACQTAKSSAGRAYLRRAAVLKRSGPSGTAQAASLERRLVRVGPKTVSPVFRAVRKIDVPLVETPPLTDRHSLAEMVAPPSVYDTLHPEVVTLMSMVDAIKIKGNKATVSEVEALVVQADAVCEMNSTVVEQVMARAPDADEAPVRVAALSVGPAPAATDGTATGGDPVLALVSADAPEASEAKVQTVAHANVQEVVLPEPTRFVTLKVAQPSAGDDVVARERIRLFAVQSRMTLDLPKGVEASIESSDALESLVVVR